MTWALDLDGVVWLAGRAIPGSARAVSELRSAGERVVFLTNNSGPVVAGHVEALGKVGVQCAPQDVTSSAQAAASMLAPGTRVAVVGDKGILEALGGQGVKTVSYTHLDVYKRQASIWSPPYPAMVIVSAFMSWLMEARLPLDWGIYAP